MKTQSFDNSQLPTPNSQLTPCRLLIDPPASGAWNMAVDEALLEDAAQSGRLCWRFYRWAEPTLSLGYFQSHDDRQRHGASLPCPVVRRPSGGGAILHDAELTYSFAVPGEHRLARRRNDLYQAVHHTLIEVLSARGIAARLRGPVTPTQDAGQPFLCFQRRSPGDVLVGETKIAGSAQRRLKGAVLQHGSVLLARSPAAPELLALEDLTATPLGQHDLVQAWLEALARRLYLSWRQEPLGEAERRRAEVLMANKYATQRWTRRRC